MRIEKKSILTVVLVIWFILSASYISWGISRSMSDAIFLNGYASAISDIMVQAENEQCFPFPVFLEDRVVELINVGCLEVPDGD